MKDFIGYFIVCVLLMMVGFGIGCATNINKVHSADSGRRLYRPDLSWDYVEGNLVVDRQTGVEYWLMDERLTLLVDKDGKPVIYKGE